MPVNLAPNIQEIVAGATFKIHIKQGGSGQCVVVEAGLIVTAAHCVDWNSTTMPAAGGSFLSKIQTANGSLMASPLAVEPVSDIAILGSPDSQAFYQEATAFDEWCESLVPVKVLRTIPKPFDPFAVWIRTHLKTWVAGMATYDGSNSTFAFETDTEILCGTSGGPIVNHAGELIGVVSHGTNSCSGGKYTSVAGLLPLAMPAWVVARIQAACA